MYNINDINVGDEVVFYSNDQQSNHNEYWTVTGKTASEIYIELKKSGFDETWTLRISDVKGHTPM